MQQPEHIYSSLLSTIDIQQHPCAMALICTAVQLEAPGPNETTTLQEVIRCLTIPGLRSLLDLEFTVLEVLRLLVWQEFIDCRPSSPHAMFLACGNRLAAEAIRTDDATDNVARARMALRMALCASMLREDVHDIQAWWYESFWSALSKKLFPDDSARLVMGALADGIRGIDRPMPTPVPVTKYIERELFLSYDNPELSMIKRYVKRYFRNPTSPVLHYVLHRSVDHYTT